MLSLVSDVAAGYFRLLELDQFKKGTIRGQNVIDSKRCCGDNRMLAWLAGS